MKNHISRAQGGRRSWSSQLDYDNRSSYAVLTIQDFDFGTLPRHLVIRVKFGTCVQDWDFLGPKFGTFIVNASIFQCIC